MADFQEVKSLIEAQAKAWHDYKDANDARLAQIEAKGHASEDAVAKVAKIDADLTSLSKTLADVQLAAARPPGGSKGATPEQLEHKQAFDRFLRKGETQGLRDIERKAMNSTTDTEGGYLVLPEVEAAIDRVVMTQSALARLARTVTIGTRSWRKRVKTAGMTLAWPGEGATSGETTEPTYSQIEVVVHPGEVEPWVENETLEDAGVDLAADLQMEAGIAFAEGEGDALINGNGVGKPRGLTAYTNVANASYAWGSIGYIASGKSAAFASVAPADKLIDLQHALPAQYRPGAVFLMPDTVLSTIRQMKDGSSAYYLWQPDPAAGFGGRLLGSPVEIDDNMPVVAANSYSVAYGNFQRAYARVVRRDIVLIRDNITAKGTTKFNFRRRIGGGVYNFEAVKLFKMATS